jgi:N utilization substance protein A
MELMQVADVVAREKNISREEVLTAMREAIEKAGQSKYGQAHDIRAHINNRGQIELQRHREVVAELDDLEDEIRQLTLAEARRIKKDIEVGEFIVDILPPLDFGRISAQTAKQVILQKVRDAERNRQYEDYKDRVGDIISGTVKRVEYGNVIVDLGQTEALLRRDETIQREIFKNGDRVRAVIYEVRKEMRGPLVFLSRTKPEFMAALFAQEVPEIYDGVIEILSVARDPGSRAKIAVVSKDRSIDPVGSCVGMRGSRVQAVVNELQGEKVDIIPWTEDVVSLAVAALAPAQVSKVILDEDKNKMEVVVAEDQLSLAIGRRGQNVRLASILIGWEIDILTEAQEAERRATEFNTRSNLFIEGLDVDETIAQLLVTEGFTSIEEIFNTPIEELNQIDGFEQEISEELQNRASNWLSSQKNRLAEQKIALGIQDDLIAMEGLSPEIVLILAENGVKSLNDFADLAGDELVEILGKDRMKEDAANALIMKARESWFNDDQADA